MQITTLFAAAAAVLLGYSAYAESDSLPATRASAAPTPATTLAIYADQTLPPGLMPALTAELKSELASDSPELQLLLPKSGAPQIQIVSQDSTQPSVPLDHVIAVYLLGDCRILPVFAERAGQLSGPLGWVQKVNGRIQPFVHVDCDGLGAMLASGSVGPNASQRNRAMARAITRVILHEWIHIASQNPGHAAHGIGQARLSVQQLIAPCAFTDY